MTKRFIQAFISLKYVFFLPPISIAIFICAMVYFNSKLAILKVVVGVLALLLLVVMGFYYSEKLSVSYKLSKISNAKEFDDAYIIGQAFLLENRMLVYRKRKLEEFLYTDVTEIRAKAGKKDHYILEIFTATSVTEIETSSKAQAQRFAAFVIAKKTDVKLVNINPEGDAILAHIESGK